MAKRLQMNVDLTDDPSLYEDAERIIVQFDIDKSKLLRIALRDKVDEIKKSKKLVIKIDPKKPL